MSTGQHVFSTGKLRIGAPGNVALSSTDDILEVQDFEITDLPSRKETNTAPWIMMYPTDHADAEKKCLVKFTAKDINQKLLPYLTGGVLSGTNPKILTVGATSTPAPCRFEFTAQSSVYTGSKNTVITGTLAVPRGLNLTAKLADFADLPVEMDVYPDPGNSDIVYTMAIDQ